MKMPLDVFIMLIMTLAACSARPVFVVEQPKISTVGKVCSPLLGNRETEECIAQEAKDKAIRKQERFKAPGATGAWGRGNMFSGGPQSIVGYRCDPGGTCRYEVQEFEGR